MSWPQILMRLLCSLAQPSWIISPSLRYADSRTSAQAGKTITNILGSFNRRLFVNLVAFLLIVTAGYLLCLIALQLALSGGMSSVNSTQSAEGAVQVDAGDITSASMLSTAIALAVGMGMLITAFGLFQRTRWGWLGTLVVSAALIILILLQLLGGQGFMGSGVIQLLVFVAIFVLFLFDSGIKTLLWEREEVAGE